MVTICGRTVLGQVLGSGQVHALPSARLWTKNPHSTKHRYLLIVATATTRRNHMNCNNKHNDTED